MISCVVENGNITFLLENPQKLAQNFTNQVSSIQSYSLAILTKISSILT